MSLKVVRGCYDKYVECLGYLHHGNIFLRRSRLNLARHLDHSFHQSRHVLVHLVIGAVQVGGGGRAYLLWLQLNRERERINERWADCLSKDPLGSENDTQRTSRDNDDDKCEPPDIKTVS